ncbi:hypothetical protein HYS48_02355, partial [Candidatus Woesearchaeota archaeon]|nr:hypothetical protein [Candidatus Woesearchaeota archaeon]
MVRIHPILGQSLEYLKLRQLHSRLQSDTSYVQHLGEVLTTVLNNATEEYIVFILGGERPETKELAMTLEAALMTTKNSLHQFAQTLQELLRGKPKDIEE